MKDIIVLHDKYHGRPIIIWLNAIEAVHAIVNEPDEMEYTDIIIPFAAISVKETIGVVMEKIAKSKKEAIGELNLKEETGDINPVEEKIEICNYFKRGNGYCMAQRFGPVVYCGGDSRLCSKED